METRGGVCPAASGVRRPWGMHRCCVGQGSSLVIVAAGREVVADETGFSLSFLPPPPFSGVLAVGGVPGVLPACGVRFACDPRAPPGFRARAPLRLCEEAWEGAEGPRAGSLRTVPTTVARAGAAGHSTDPGVSEAPKLLSWAPEGESAGFGLPSARNNPHDKVAHVGRPVLRPPVPKQDTRTISASP